MFKLIWANAWPKSKNSLIAVLSWSVLQIVIYYRIPPLFSYRQDVISTTIDKNSDATSEVKATLQNNSVNNAIKKLQVIFTYKSSIGRIDTVYPKFVKASVAAISPASLSDSIAISPDSNTLTTYFPIVQPGNTYVVYFSVCRSLSQPSFPQIHVNCQQAVHSEPYGAKEWVYGHWLSINLFLSVVIFIVLCIFNSSSLPPQIPDSLVDVQRKN
jgi:hypothetical protein